MPIKKVTLEMDRCRVELNQKTGRYETYTQFNQCNTRMHEERRHIVYSNVIRVYYLNTTASNSLIERTTSMNIKVECRLQKTQINTLKGNPINGTGEGNGTQGIIVGPQYIEIHDTTQANASFRIDFQVYRSLAYSHSYGREEFPIYLQVSNRIYFEVAIDKDELSILPETCYATKTNSYQDEPRYYLNQNSCPKDQTYVVHNQGTDQSKFRFSVQAFNFKDGGDSIFVHCHTYVCKNTTDKKCQFGCRDNDRRRRSIELKEEIEGYMTSSLEIKIKGEKIEVIQHQPSSASNDPQSSSGNSSKNMLLYLQIPVAVAIIGLFFMLYKCSQRRGGYRQQQPEDLKVML